MDSADAYIKTFRGRFSGIMRWAQLGELWNKVRADAAGGWYIYAIGESPPEAPADGDQVRRFLEEIDSVIRKDHGEDYCGIVYTDSREHPEFVKIYDPNNLGVVCGTSENPPLPGWTLSKLKPVNLPQAFPVPANRRRWWRRLFN
jgi:hypothetical protein